MGLGLEQYHSSTDETWRSGIRNVAAIASAPPEVIEYDVEGLLPSDDAPALMFGAPGSFKSWIALHACDAVVTGKPLFGKFQVRQRERAVYVNLDAGAKTFAQRVRRVSSSAAIDIVNISSADFSFAILCEILKAYPRAFVVFDCFSDMYRPDRNNDPAIAMRDFTTGLRAEFARYQCGGLVIDHPHRPKERGELGDYHGSIQKEAAFRTMWSVVAEPAEKKFPRRVKILCRKLSEGEPFAPVMVAVDFSTERIAFSGIDHDPAAVLEQTESRLIAWSLIQAEAFSKNECQKAIDGGRNSDKRNAFDRLIRRGVFVESGGKRGGAPTFVHSTKTSPVLQGELGRSGRTEPE